ncbi:hypothetical protein B0T20DRAFT_393536 [Sordaria brevicollis]|uniref:Uncharacterized protein n=1 Tax=Sordaria brevicollis TaxID=83679 RepID=A0AAE0PDZ0_SORBR|nr:hypothetical protein B0T20DRAFT_393536 [Sordaria brevicollis]
MASSLNPSKKTKQMKLPKAVKNIPIQGSLAVWTCPEPCCQHKERETQKGCRRRDTDKPKGWRLFFLSLYWKKPCKTPQRNKVGECMASQLRDRMPETEARRKATLAAKSYGWTATPPQQRKQRQKNPETNHNGSNGARSARRTSSYSLYGQVLQMLPAEDFNRYVKGRPTPMIAPESKQEGYRAPPSVRRRPPLPKLSLVIPGNEGEAVGGSRRIPLGYPVSPVSTVHNLPYPPSHEECLSPLSEAGKEYMRL